MTTNEKPTRRLFSRTCTECGCEFTTPVRTADFCSKEHRMTYHNRRRDRGAELFDLVMKMRFERADARRDGTWSHVCALASAYHAADKLAGRKSWDSQAAARLPLSYDAIGGDGR